MESTEILGFMAGTFVAASLVPQLIKSWKSKSTRDISIFWPAINTIGQILWITYGVFINSPSIVIMSIVILIMAMSIFTLKVKHG